MEKCNFDDSALLTNFIFHIYLLLPLPALIGAGATRATIEK